MSRQKLPTEYTRASRSHKRRNKRAAHFATHFNVRADECNAAVCVKAGEPGIQSSRDERFGFGGRREHVRRQVDLSRGGAFAGQGIHSAGTTARSVSFRSLSVSEGGSVLNRLR